MKFKNRSLITILTILFIPIIIGIGVNYLSWYRTRSRTEVTLTLEGWITIGSVVFGDLPGLRLTLNNEPVKNILKISWTIANTGNRGIASFETGPTIRFPRGLEIVRAVVSDTSPLLKVAQQLRVIGNQARVDSLGIFNAGDHLAVDIYLKDVRSPKIDPEFFDHWALSANALDLKTATDVSLASREARSQRRTSEGKPATWVLIVAASLTVLLEVWVIRSSKSGRRAVIQALGMILGVNLDRNSE